jgi:sulfite reductase alpha subunit-like flavoprotein
MSPVLAVGPGTGLAPFVGFIEHRQETLRLKTLNAPDMTFGKRSGNILCFTSASLKGDLIYTDRIKNEWIQCQFSVGVLVSLTQEEEKRRVTSVMKDYATEIVDLLVNKGGYYYCCGDGKMSHDVNNELICMIMAVQGISRINAVAIVQQLRQEGRYQLDIWGTMSFFNDGKFFLDMDTDHSKDRLKLTRNRLLEKI